ncbi:hypothetical protein A2154_03805 [Candidatus Gottesmanbacteria bacterium RBG_16_43_7]|uniref:PIN domain-containing protein n=1 Tax=Candidatus Gottesmanbacteria bacterium RBG_16_43_7 TaxID=1798373 RepID=A0A1F5Z8H5_9BACT|nr:MAG: hypothetical protein A2154_03805 [Candidatus Gottesmanbacteria bacterium RBG_16_43_7]
MVSAIISQKGAAYELLGKKSIALITSVTVNKEVKEVARRLKISIPKKIFLVVKVIQINLDKPELTKRYSRSVIDAEDTHVVAGAVKAESDFLLIYNTRHYKVEHIKQKYGIHIMKPGKFLQYLRSVN